MTSLLTIIAILLALSGFSIFPLYHRRRQALINHIKELLKQLRSMDSWDDRSELKLFQWMNSSDESTLHYRSLLELRNILSSLTTYWAIHMSMIDDDFGSTEDTIKEWSKEPEKWSFKFISRELFFPKKPRMLI